MPEIQEIWTEKYRPQLLKEVVGQENAVKRLNYFVESKSLPHCMFAGPAGVGKTTCALAIARELFGENWHSNFLELNASDERGIDTIRVKVKDFARTMPIAGSFKLVCLDEADSLTRDAQHALRRTMENYADSCRFILACVSPDTKVLLPEEVEVRIDKLPDNRSYEVMSIDEKRDLIEREKVIAHIELDPKIIGKKTLRITTMSGRYLDLTDDHPLLTTNGWKKSENINVGDKIAVFPHLEDTEPISDTKIIISEDELENFLNISEPSYTKRKIDATNYINATSDLRRNIKNRILELSKLLEDGLTKQEYFVYQIICRRDMSSRKKIQESTTTSRIWINQLLKSLEKKGFITRCVNRTNHSFTATKKKVHLLRNKMDICRKIHEEFGIRVSHKTIENILNGSMQKQYGKEGVLLSLRKHGLIPLSYNNPKIGIITRLSGFLLGDGHITKNHQRLIFTGDAESLEGIRKEIVSLGFKPSRIYSKKINGCINLRRICGTTTWFYLDSRPLCLLFESLGIPAGDKITKDFFVPEWVFNGPRFVKREFLRALFGSEMDAPKCYKKNFSAINFRQHKLLRLSKTAKIYGKQIVDLLDQFEIRSKLKITKLDYNSGRKNSDYVCEIRIVLGASNKNLYTFFRTIGYIYSNEKGRKGRYALEYLRHKFYTLERQKKISEEIIAELNTGQSLRSLAKKFNCSVDFVINQKCGKDVHLLRNFPTFNEWTSKFKIDKSPLIWNEVISIEDIELNRVMDITCLKNHNFISNGIVSHNCNYINKIIPPIQSRCAIFKFLPLKESQVVRFLQYITKEEKLGADNDTLKAIFDVSEGDMRKAVNLLQTAALDGKITKESVYALASRDPENVRKMMLFAINGRFKEARSVLLSLFNEHGLAGEDIIKEIHEQVFALDIDDKQKIALIEKVGEAEFRITEGSNPRIQLEALIAQFALIGVRERLR